jgi:hypothetical protein
LSDLFDVARQVPPPPIDVAERVADTVRARPVFAGSDGPLWLAAAVSAAAAAIVLLMVFAQHAAVNDPFVEWLSSYVLVSL